MLLNVSAPFHCQLMKPAAEAMAEAQPAATIAAPIVPSSPTSPPRRPERSRGDPPATGGQVTGTVRWRESVSAMAGAGVDKFVEVGAGKVLSGLIRRIAPAEK